jgi:hypothetical protein
MMFDIPILFWTIRLAQQVQSSDIRDIKGPIIYSSYLPLFLIAGASIALLTGLLLFYILRIKNKKKVIPLRPSHEIAYEALEQLRMKELPEKGRVSDYYFELSGVIRNYLDNRFHLRTMELTTEELIQRIEESKKFSPEQKSLVSHFFVQCDLVKFAGYRPFPEEIESSYKASREIIDQTKEGIER